MGDGLSNVTFIGSQTTGGVKHEGYSGWSFASFNGSGSPFYNESTSLIDFANYATEQGVSSIDVMPVILGWNSTFEDLTTYRNRVETFIANVHAAFPSCKIMLFSIPFPSLDGLGASYGCSWAYVEKAGRVHDYDELYADIANDHDNVSFYNLSGLFDAEYNYPSVAVSVNKRNTTQIQRQTNGVHPDSTGYLQIADAVYRAITHILKEG